MEINFSDTIEKVADNNMKCFYLQRMSLWMLPAASLHVIKTLSLQHHMCRSNGVTT